MNKKLSLLAPLMIFSGILSFILVSIKKKPRKVSLYCGKTEVFRLPDESSEKYFRFW